MMADMYKSHSDFLMEEAEAKGEAKGKLQEKLVIAKNFLNDFGNESLSLKIGLPLAEIEQLRANS